VRPRPIQHFILFVDAIFRGRDLIELNAFTGMLDLIVIFPAFAAASRPASRPLGAGTTAGGRANTLGHLEEFDDIALSNLAAAQALATKDASRQALAAEYTILEARARNFRP
jgi:hypothetical protein